MSLDITSMNAALGAYNRHYPGAMVPVFYNKEDQVSPHTKTITKVNGEYPVVHSLTGHVIQGFTTTWNEMGVTSFKAKKLTAFRQKINIGIVPAEILSTFKGDMYEEGVKDLASKSIAKYIIDKEIGPRAKDDLNELMCTGVYDAGNLGVFGKAMNGIAKIIELGTASVTDPMYKIPMTAITDTNAYDEFLKFDMAVPHGLASRIKKVFTSRKNVNNYKIDVRNTYGTHTDFSAGAFSKTPLNNYDIVGLDFLPDDVFFATVDGNLVKLIDDFNGPAMTDIQKADYKLKLFFEFTLGIEFLVNQLVVVGVFGGTKEGFLDTAVGTDIYFAGQKTHIA